MPLWVILRIKNRGPKPPVVFTCFSFRRGCRSVALHSEEPRPSVVERNADFAVSERQDRPGASQTRGGFDHAAQAVATSDDDLTAVHHRSWELVAHRAGFEVREHQRL